jgi:hypothetical protein
VALGARFGFRMPLYAILRFSVGLVIVAGGLAETVERRVAWSARRRSSDTGDRDEDRSGASAGRPPPVFVAGLRFDGERFRRIRSRAVASRSRARVTVIDGALAAAVLAGVVLNTTAGWWWADPVSAVVILAYGLREARDAWAEAALA